MKIVAWVPIKLNNQRLPGKNLMMLGDKPLCRHMLDMLISVKHLDEIIVFCSDEMITKFLPDGVRWLKRDTRLDTAETIAAEIIDAFTTEVDADIYVNAHVTNPFITAKTIEMGISKVKSGEYQSAHVVIPVQNHLWYQGKPWNFTIDSIPRTQDLEPIYEDAGLFIYQKEVWTKGRSRYSDRPYLIEVSRTEGIDIDDAEDMRLCEAIYQSDIKGD